MAIENIEHDPDWHAGNYSTEPVNGLRGANEMLMIMSAAPLVLQKAYPTREAAERYVDNYLAQAPTRYDANNMIYFFDASRNYDPSARLGQITAHVMWINSADDFINPPELGLAEQQVKQISHGHFYNLPISAATRGHGTHTLAALWKDHLLELMKESEPR